MLPELLKNATLLDDDVDNYHKPNSRVSYAYLETEAYIDGKRHRIVLDIRKSPHKNMFWAHSIYKIDESQALLATSEATPGLAIKEMLDYRDDSTTVMKISQGNNSKVKKSLKALDTEYLNAARNGDTETAQKLVDEAAKAAEYRFRLYHQTENDFTVFDTKHKGAGTGDYETPFGIFMKPSSADIGLKGQKQMPLYAKIDRPLTVSDRSNLMHELRQSEKVVAVQNKIKAVNEEYDAKVKQAGKDLQNYLIEYRKNHPDEPRSEIYNDEGFNEIYEREDTLIDEWTEKVNELALESKEAITEYLKSSGYDGVIIENDKGSFGRSTKTYIALDNTQVKSAEAVVYGDDGKIVPLSERFDSGKSDIRFSYKAEEARKQSQLEIINKTNPAPNTYSTWIRTVDDIKTLAETLTDEEWNYEEFNPDLSRTDILNAVESGRITVYSSYPIKNGVFVSPSRMEAESYSGNGKVYQETVDINDVAWIDPTQGQLAKVEIKKSLKAEDDAPSAIDRYYAEAIRENRAFSQIFALMGDMYSSKMGDVYLDKEREL